MRRVDFLADLLVVRQHHARARAAQRLVRRGGDDMGVRQRARMQPGGHQSRKMRHVDHEIGADGVGDLAEAREVDDARIGRAAGDDHRGLVLLRKFLDLVVVDAVVVLAHAVLHGVEPLAGQVRRRAMGQVPAMGERHAEDRVARLDQREHHRLVGLAARMRLHVGEGAVEQALGAVDGELLDDVDILAAAVIAPARIAFGIFVGEQRTGGLEHGCETMFSEAISSISSCWRLCSFWMAPQTSGSASSRWLVKKPLSRASARIFRHRSLSSLPLLELPDAQV